MSFVFDENNAGIKPIEAGEYEVYANAYDLTTTQGTGNQMIVMNYYIRDDIHQNGSGSEIKFDNFVDTEKARWRFNSLAKAVGTPHGFDFGSVDNWAQMMLGKPVRVVIELELNTNNGKKNPKVKLFKPSTTPMNSQPVYKESRQQGISNAASRVSQSYSNNQYSNQNSNYSHPAEQQQNHQQSYQQSNGIDPMQAGNNFPPIPDDQPF